MALATFALVSFGCADDEQAESNVVGGTVDTLTASVMLSIGSLDGPDEQVVSRVFSGFRRGDRVFIAHGAVPEIRRYDISGQLVQRIGRAGAGPGEFRHLRWVAPFGNDSVVALDGELSRVTVFDQNGVYGRSFHLGLEAYQQGDWIAEYGDGFAVGIMHGVDPRLLEVGQTVRDSFSIGFVGREYDQDRVSIRTASPPFGGRLWRRREAVAAFGVEAIEDGPHPLVSLGDTTLMAGSSDSGKLLRWNGITEAWDSVAPEVEVGVSGDVPEAPELPERVYEHLAVGEEGEFWLSESRIDEDEQRVWWVFGPNGRPRSTLRLPASFVIWQIGNGWILGRRLGDAGVEYVEILEVGVRGGNE